MINLALIFEWQFFATLIQAVRVMEISFIGFSFMGEHLFVRREAE